MKKERVKSIDVLAKKRTAVPMTFSADKALINRFNEYCKGNGLNKSYIIRELINDYLKGK